MDYELNKESALAGSSQAGSKIESGLYAVKINQAFEFTAKTGTKGVQLDVETANGQFGRIELYVENTSGKKIFGADVLQAIMACTSTQSLMPQLGEVEFYNFDKREVDKKQATCLMGLIGKKLYIVMKLEAYKANDGSGKLRSQLVAPLTLADKQTAQEFINGADANEWESIVRYADDGSELARKEANLISSASMNASFQSPTAQPSNSPQGQAQASQGAGGFDDALPDW